MATAGLLSLSLGGCMASGQVHSSASVSAPDLVYIGPSVQVIADWNEPVFYSSNYYWRYDGGVWYRSSNHLNGWMRIQTVPAAILQIERPTAYIHYRAQGSANASAQPTQATPHDQRDAAHEARDERHEAKAEEKEERKEAKAEAKEERKDAKADHKDGKPSKGH
ncbi:MAG TPA: hypothetical protein VMZ53_30955 [Kofleriaceae bacterium]|nr:hypothetical protein [Kofleriaceae bacterium]